MSRFPYIYFRPENIGPVGARYRGLRSHWPLVPPGTCLTEKPSSPPDLTLLPVREFPLKYSMVQSVFVRHVPQRDAFPGSNVVMSNPIEFICHLKGKAQEIFGFSCCK